MDKTVATREWDLSYLSPPAVCFHVTETGRLEAASKWRRYRQLALPGKLHLPTSVWQEGNYFSLGLLTLGLPILW